MHTKALAQAKETEGNPTLSGKGASVFGRGKYMCGLN